jgi:hypothetical protein
MTWTRSGDVPDKQILSFQVCAKNHPKLAKWIWGLPYRQSSKIVRDLLEAAIETAESMSGQNLPSEISGGRQSQKGGDTLAKQPDDVTLAHEPAPIATKGNTAHAGITSAAAEVISRFDGMFPGVNK